MGLDSVVDDLVDRVCRYRVEDLVITYCNPAWAVAFGQVPADLIGRSLATLLVGEELAGLHRQLRVLEATAEVATQEIHRVVDGLDRWEQWVDRLLVREDGTREVLAVARDVTDRVVAEVRLREAEDSLRATLDGLTSGILVIDVDDGRIIYANAVYGTLVAPGQELVGADALSTVRPENVDAVRARHEAAARGEPVPPLVLGVPGPGGVTCRVEFTERRMRFGGRDALLVIARDVTAWLEAQERTAAEGARTLALLDQLPAPVVARRGDDTIAYANVAAARSYGYEHAAELIGQSMYDLVHPDDRARVIAAVQAGQSAQTAPFEVRQLRRDGSDRLVEFRTVSVELDGTPTRLAVLRDITAERDAFDALAASERRLSTMFDAVHESMITIDGDGLISSVNRAAAENLGTEPEILIGVHHRDVFASYAAANPAMAELLERIEAGVLRDGATIEDEAIRLDVADQHRWFRYSVVPVVEFGAEGAQGAVATFRDVTAEHDLQAALSASEALFRALADSAPIGIATLDVDGRPEYCNRTQTDLMGLPPGVPDVGGWRAAIHPDDHAIVDAAWLRAQQGSPREHVELRYVTPDGETRYVRAHLVPLPNRDGFLSTSVDLTERYALEQRLAHDATHDSLTGLPNRVLLLDRLDTALRAAERDGIWPALLFCDLDRFKAVNDEHGHAAGDELLCQVAERLTRCVRHADTVARLGGDEFVVLCHGARSTDEIDLVAGRIIDALEEPFELVEGVTVRIGVSIGITDDHAGESATAILRRADLAVYEAKRSGRGVAWRFHQPGPEPVATASRRGVVGRPGGS
jgi:diguanylate cyclase (GGDEF)-like protein/PAS domain S-box-containing protein